MFLRPACGAHLGDLVPGAAVLLSDAWDVVFHPRQYALPVIRQTLIASLSVTSRRRSSGVSQGTIGTPMARTRNNRTTITMATIQIHFPHATTTGLASPGAASREGRTAAPTIATATSPRPTSSGRGSPPRNRYATKT